MSEASCVLVAGRHPVLTEGIRGLLETIFQVVVTVADWRSLVPAAQRLGVRLAIIDLAVAEGRMGELVAELRLQCPQIKVIALSVDDQPAVAVAMMRAGVDRFIALRDVATDLLPAAEAMLAQQLPNEPERIQEAGK